MEIVTIGDLINELKKYDETMRIKKLDLSPSDILGLKVQQVNDYNIDGSIKGKYDALVIR